MGQVLRGWGERLLATDLASSLAFSARTFYHIDSELINEFVQRRACLFVVCLVELRTALVLRKQWCGLRVFLKFEA
jgi:hypothetical protein